jgi:hypothetical protein
MAWATVKSGVESRDEATSPSRGPVNTPPTTGGSVRAGVKRYLWVVLVGVWAAGLAAGFTTLWRYKSTPSLADGIPPPEWPSSARITRAPGQQTLVVFAHPMCPCTRASITVLGKLLPRLGPEVSAWVVVARAADDPNWDEAELWDRAASIPGVRVFRDDDGVEAERFHAATSGLTLLYDAAGRLRFAGGITAQRGHEGDSFGPRRIESLVKTGTADRADSPVFGCTLLQTSVPTSN